jgi:hypothetical protein
MKAIHIIMYDVDLPEYEQFNATILVGDGFDVKALEKELDEDGTIRKEFYALQELVEQDDYEGDWDMNWDEYVKDVFKKRNYSGLELVEIYSF